MCHKPTPEAVVEAVVKVIVTCKVVLWKDDQHSLVVPNKGGG